MKALFISFVLQMAIPAFVDAPLDVTVTSEQDNFKKGYRLVANKMKMGTYTCTVNFKQLLGIPVPKAVIISM